MQVQSLSQEDPWRRVWQPTPVFLPGESHGQKCLVGYSPWAQSATNEATGHTCTQSMFIMEKKKFSYMRPLALCKIPQGKIVNASA